MKTRTKKFCFRAHELSPQLNERVKSCSRFLEGYTLLLLFYSTTSYSTYSYSDSWK